GYVDTDYLPHFGPYYRFYVDPEYRRRYGAVLRKNAISALVNFLNDPDPDVRNAVILALGRLGRDASVTVGQIVDHLKTDRDSVRVAAAQALGSIGDHETTVPTLLEALNDEDEAVAKAAAGALGTIGEDAKSGLIDYLKTPPEVSSA